MELTTLLENAIEGWYRFDINLEDRDLGSVEHLKLNSARLDHRGLFIETAYGEQRMGIYYDESWFGYRSELTFVFGRKSDHLKCYVFNGLPDYLNVESWYNCMTKTAHSGQNPESRLVSDRPPASRRVLDKYLELHNVEDDFQVISIIAKSLLIPSGFKCFPLFRLFIAADDGLEPVAKKH